MGWITDGGRSLRSMHREATLVSLGLFNETCVQIGASLFIIGLGAAGFDPKNDRSDQPGVALAYPKFLHIFMYGSGLILCGINYMRFPIKGDRLKQLEAFKDAWYSRKPSTTRRV